MKALIHELLAKHCIFCPDYPLHLVLENVRKLQIACFIPAPTSPKSDNIVLLKFHDSNWLNSYRCGYGQFKTGECGKFPSAIFFFYLFRSFHSSYFDFFSIRQWVKMKFTQNKPFQNPREHNTRALFSETLESGVASNWTPSTAASIALSNLL